MALLENLLGNRKSKKKGPLGMPLGPVRKALSERKLLIEHPRIFPDEHPVMSPAGAGEIQGFIFRKKPEPEPERFTTEEIKEIESKSRKFWKGVEPGIRKLLEREAPKMLSPGARFEIVEQPPMKQRSVTRYRIIAGGSSWVDIWPIGLDSSGIPGYSFEYWTFKEAKKLAKKIADVMDQHGDELIAKIKKGKVVF